MMLLIMFVQILQVHGCELGYLEVCHQYLSLLALVKSLKAKTDLFPVLGAPGSQIGIISMQ